MEFEVVHGDVAAQSADALVNAANTGLQMGSGVAGALRSGADDGAALNEAAAAKGPVDLGDVAVTDPYGLDCDYVLHAAGMPAGGQATARSIRESARNALRVADALRCRSVVLPAIGCGVAGFALEDGAEIVCEEIDAFRPRCLDDVRFVAYADEEYETMREVAGRVQSRRSGK